GCGRPATVSVCPSRSRSRSLRLCACAATDGVGPCSDRQAAITATGRPVCRTPGRQGGLRGVVPARAGRPAGTVSAMKIVRRIRRGRVAEAPRVRYLVAPAGHPNYGDELIARVWLARLAAQYPHDRVVL